jgi:hypothetical protein
MLKTFLCFALLIASFSKGQTFYEKIMEMNIAIADTSTDRAVLDMSAKAMERVSRGIANNWDSNFHMALCFVRMTDISLALKDTIGAKIAVAMSALQLKKTDTLRPQNAELKILGFYHKINELRIPKKRDLKSIKLLETQLENFRKSNTSNPRIYLVNAYFNKCFYGVNKVKKKQALELLQQSNKLFDAEKPKGYEPKWGRKWMNELTAELSAKPK